MSLFQLIGVSVFAVLITIDILGMLRGYPERKARVLWLMLWCAGAGAILAPDTMTEIALALGIQRGTDLVLYSAVLAGMAIAFFTYIHFRKLDRQITLIVRQIALEHAKLQGESATGGNANPRHPPGETP